VSLALHSVLGVPLWVFMLLVFDTFGRFSVTSYHVGFLVRDLNRAATDHFNVYFHLWRDGGADWFREWNKWQQEKDASGQHVERRKHMPPAVKHVSFAHKLVQDSPKSKSTPRELSTSVKSEEFSCNISSSACPKSQPAQVRSFNLNSNSNSTSIDASLMFGQLKGQLGMPYSA
jgi:hypothetical protein